MADWSGTFQANVVLGILAAYCSNWYIATLHLGALEWRWQLGIALFPALLFLVLLYTIPQSSRFLVTRNSLADALAVLRQMGTDEPEADLETIRQSLHRERDAVAPPLFTKSLRLPIFLAITIGLFNQLSGINAILYYANDIFAAAGLSRLSTFSQSIYIGLANMVGTVLGMLLIDRIGRKTLLLIGAAGTFACLLATATLFHTGLHPEYIVWLLVVFIAFFGMSQGAVIWVYISEIFPTQVRSKGQSLGGSAHWIMDALVALLFPLMVAQFSRAAPFYFFAGMTALQFFVVLFIYPETKGRTLEQLQAQLSH